ncbi:MAG: GNAT family N-acetyltransferase [Saprospiraceae bacterium]|nr:GNAT family N-acetyltransferase [Saprospiraceae bacterium]
MIDAGIATSHRIFTSIRECADSLKQLDITELLLDVPYLTAVESGMGEYMDFRYLVFFEKDVPQGFMYFQLHPFEAKESLKELRDSKCSDHLIKKALASRVTFKALVNGNLLLTGPFGFYFKRGFSGNHKALIKKAMVDLFDREQEEKNVSVLFIKDLPESYIQGESLLLDREDFFSFKVQPSMVLKIRPEWTGFPSYVAALKSKYRVRINRALERGRSLHSRNISLEGIEGEKTQFNRLLQNVLVESDFRIVNFDIHYILALKRHLGDSFHIKGYYHDGSLVGFMTSFIMRDKILAHFTGFEIALNKEFDLYLNMLLDLIEMAIELRVSALDLSRTALEIKSSIGAEPQEMTNLIQHYHNGKQRLLPKVFSMLYQSETWVQRKPFREVSNGFS